MRLLFLLLLLLGAVSATAFDPTGVQKVLAAAVAARAFPGATAVVGTAEGVVWTGAVGAFTYGGAPVPPFASRPMDADGTTFDLASLTKVVATTTAVAQLVEGGLLGLEAPVAEALGDAAFGRHGKGAVTVRQLLLHEAGFPPDPSPNYWEAGFGCPGNDAPTPPPSFRCQGLVYAAVMNQTLQYAPGTQAVYSDLSFLTAMLVVGHQARLHGLVLPSQLRPACGDATQCYYEAYVRLHVLQPLFGDAVGFIPAPAARPACAPTEDDGVYGR